MNKPKWIILGCGVVLLAIVALESPTVTSMRARFREKQKELHLAMGGGMDRAHFLSLMLQGAPLEYEHDPSTGVGWPVDIGITSQTAYFDLLIRASWLRPDQLKGIRDAMGNFAIGNISAKDPLDTVMIASQNYVDAVIQGKTTVSDPYIIFHKGGDGMVYPAGTISKEPLPPRDPPFLAP